MSRGRMFVPEGTAAGTVDFCLFGKKAKMLVWLKGEQREDKQEMREVRGKTDYMVKYLPGHHKAFSFHTKIRSRWRSRAETGCDISNI